MASGRALTAEVAFTALCMLVIGGMQHFSLFLSFSLFISHALFFIAFYSSLPCTLFTC
jgi:hypothetical protein